MCGRYNLRATPAQLKEFFNLFREPEGADRPRYNIAPAYQVVDFTQAVLNRVEIHAVCRTCRSSESEILDIG
ncbi:SOS response-associated peptidase family protein [Planctomicrobium piriforme]|uniref:SOS response associated peptidase (SRAP) n=1 Tax=Planctomicrobium piriforme TaxID=1576369 RepID=A0A1I3DZZ4_9PLAN|nr:SOS response-associated peptidase family protein [Planctomicrobium piriforme]SFH92286.1 hypothetical protein SAMN05421753_10423 [Planctomicrobium piriforme]